MNRSDGLRSAVRAFLPAIVLLSLSVSLAADEHGPTNCTPDDYCNDEDCQAIDPDLKCCRANCLSSWDSYAWCCCEECCAYTDPDSGEECHGCAFKGWECCGWTGIPPLHHCCDAQVAWWCADGTACCEGAEPSCCPEAHHNCLNHPLVQGSHLCCEGLNSSVCVNYEALAPAVCCESGVCCGPLGEQDCCPVTAPVCLDIPETDLHMCCPVGSVDVCSTGLPSLGYVCCDQECCGPPNQQRCCTTGVSECCNNTTCCTLDKTCCGDGPDSEYPGYCCFPSTPECCHGTCCSTVDTCCGDGPNPEYPGYCCLPAKPQCCYGSCCKAEGLCCDDRPNPAASGYC